MKVQEYECEKCGVESHVSHSEHAGVMEVVHLIEDDHRKWSPECDNPTTKLRVFNPAISNKLLDLTGNTSPQDPA